MTGTNNFLPVATAAGANVQSQADYAGSSPQLQGNAAGLALSAVINKMLRQATFISAGLAQEVANQNLNVPDDGDLDAFVANLDAALKTVAAYDVPFIAGWGADFLGEDLLVQLYGASIATRALTILGETCRCEVAPTGANLIFDILKNGVSVYTTKPFIAAGSTTGTAGVLDGTKTSVVVGDLLNWSVTQVGSTVAGQKATFTLQGRRT